jgi:hypothetical protein
VPCHGSLGPSDDFWRPHDQKKDDLRKNLADIRVDRNYRYLQIHFGENYPSRKETETKEKKLKDFICSSVCVRSYVFTLWLPALL